MTGFGQVLMMKNGPGHASPARPQQTHARATDRERSPVYGRHVRRFDKVFPRMQRMI
jgi:hypothetical protein